MEKRLCSHYILYAIFIFNDIVYVNDTVNSFLLVNVFFVFLHYQVLK